MLRFLALAAIVLALSSTTVSAQPKYETHGKIVRLDPRLDSIIPRDAKMERLASGFEWSEGPAWHKTEKYLLFSDIPKNEIVRWTEADKTKSFIQPSGYTGKEKFTGEEPGTNGLAFDSDGNLIMCCHGDRQVVRLDMKTRERKTLADKYDGRRLNSPNDLAFNRAGDIYFTDPPYGLPKRYDDPARELDWCGVYRLAKDGKLTLLTKEMTRPNGIAFSPDYRTLYVAQSDPKAAIWKAFIVNSDGTLGKGRLFYDTTQHVDKPDWPGLPDGLKVDEQGNLFATGPGGVWIFTPAGKPLGRLETGEKTANCAFGDDGRTLYITADMHLLRIRTNTKGIGF